MEQERQWYMTILHLVFWPAAVLCSLIVFNILLQHSYPPNIPTYDFFVWQIIRPIYLTYMHGSAMHFLSNMATTSILVFTISIFIRSKYVGILLLCGYMTSYIYIYFYEGIGFSIISYFIQGSLTILVFVIIYTEIIHILSHDYSPKQKTIMLSFMFLISMSVLFIVFLFANEVLIALQYIPIDSSLIIDISYPNGYSRYSAKAHTVGYTIGTITMIPIIQFADYANIEL